MKYANTVQKEESADLNEWTPADMRIDFILQKWGEWARMNGPHIGYPKSQPFAVRARGREPISDELAEKAEAALCKIDYNYMFVLKGYYYMGRHNSFRESLLLKSIREFGNAYDS